MNHKRQVLSIAFVWVFTFGLTYPYIHVLSIKDGSCWDNWNSPVDAFIYFSIYMGLTWIISPIIMAVCYSVSLYKLNKTSVINNNHMAMIQRRQQNKKLTIMFAFIVLIFFITTFPYAVNFLVYSYWNAFDKERVQKHRNLLTHLNYGLFTISAFNSTVNCFIYAKMHTGVIYSVRKFKSQVLRSLSRRKRFHNLELSSISNNTQCEDCVVTNIQNNIYEKH